MDWLKCNICFNTYNDSNLRPRVLSCGHSFCERCLTNTIQHKSLACPQCRKIHDINSVADLPINFVLEGLLKSLNPCSQDVSKGAISGPIAEQCDQVDKNETKDSLKSILEPKKSLSAQKELLKTSAGICNEHPCNELLFRCSSHKCWVCEKCTEESGDHPKDYCSITSFKEEIEYRKQEQKISLDNEEKSCDETLIVIESHISYLSDNREHHICLINALQDLVNIHKKEDENLLSEKKTFEKILENGKSLKQKLLDAKVTILNAETLDESIAARDVVENKKTVARDWAENSEREVNQGKLKVQTSTHLALSTKSSLEYRKQDGLLHQEIERNTIQLEPNEPTENKINSKSFEFMRKNESRISEATNEDLCKSHNKAIGHRCLTCKRFICYDCLKYHTKVTGCSTIIASTAVKSMKDEHSKSIDVLLSTFEEDTKYFVSKIQKHNDNIQEITDKKKELSEQATEYTKEIKKYQNVLDQGKLQKENLIKSMNHLSAKNSPYAVMDGIEVLDDMKQALRSWSIMTQRRNISDDIKKALKGGKDVYVEMMIKDEKKIGKCSQHENYIYFHTFRAQAGTHDSICMPYDCVQKLIPSGSLVFMELSLGGKVKGRITIRLDVNLPNARKHMVNIVTGKDGVSLAGIDLNFQNSDCIGNQELTFSEMKVTPDKIRTPKANKCDVVVSYDNDYLRAIYFQVHADELSDDDANSYSRVIGYIVTGLHIIQECYDNYTHDVMISDCGLLLEWE